MTLFAECFSPPKKLVVSLLTWPKTWDICNQVLLSPTWPKILHRSWLTSATQRHRSHDIRGCGKGFQINHDEVCRILSFNISSIPWMYFDHFREVDVAAFTAGWSVYEMSVLPVRVQLLWNRLHVCTGRRANSKDLFRFWSMDLSNTFISWRNLDNGLRLNGWGR